MRSNPLLDKLIVALDVSSSQRALELVRALKGEVSWFKIGLQLFTAAGTSVVREVLKEGVRVFLDLKFHDIPNTASRAVVEAGRLGIEMMTLHTLGGETMLRHARETLLDHSEKEGWPCPKLLGVTVLTSMDQQALSAIGVSWGMEEAVRRLAESATRAGLDGVVSSPRELHLFRQSQFDGLIRVTPGIRPAASAADDQARTMTPSQALASGADLLVVGRPITGAKDPARAAHDLFEPERNGVQGGTH